MQTRCALIKLKPNALDRVTAWASTLKSRRQEVTETLAKEGVVLESAFLAQIGDDDYLVYLMRSGDFEAARRAGANSTAAIDEFHRQFKIDTWLERTELTPLIDFAYPDDGSE